MTATLTRSLDQTKLEDAQVGPRQHDEMSRDSSPISGAYVNTREVYVYSHTHWDRAWYAPLATFQHRLVQHMDDLLQTLERDPGFAAYTCDGQTAMIEDYLAVRPERAAGIADQVRAGRLEIGPWYVQPDLFLPCGESLIRNLLHGRRTAAGFGGAMAVGYLPDSFGLCSQLPAILAGFGIRDTVFSRGMGPEVQTLGCEFTWRAQGPDAVTCHWMTRSYGTGSHLGFVVWWGIPEGHDFSAERGVQQIAGLVAHQSTLSRSGVFLIPNGVDHCPVERNVPAVVAAANRDPSWRVHHARLEDYTVAVRNRTGGRLATYQGELVSTWSGMTLQGTLSSRLYLKQANRRAEDTLLRLAEPLAALASRHADGPDEAPILRHAWKTLIQCHPHDDICGCSVDAVHRGNEFRFGEVQAMADIVADESLMRLANACAQPAPGRVPLVLFNPHGFPVRGVVAVAVGFEPHEATLADAFRVTDPLGATVAMARTGEHREDRIRVPRLQWKRRMVELLLEVDLPPCGCVAYAIEAGSPPTTPPRVRVMDGVIDNGLVRVAVHADGSIDLVEVANGRSFPGINRLEDEADRGDSYDFFPLADAVPIRAMPAAPLRFEQTALHATAFAEVVLDLPAGLDAARIRRSGSAPLHLRVEVRVTAASPRVDIRVTGMNAASDHRLRVRLPTGTTGTSHHVGQAFAVLERTDVQPWDATYGAPVSPTRCMHRFVDLADAGGGLAVIADGLPEYEVADRDVLLTLLRAVGWLSRGDLATRPGDAGPSLATPDAQCRRAIDCRYAVLPHAGDWRQAGVDRQALLHAVPPVAQRGDVVLGTDPRHFDDPRLTAAITFTLPLKQGVLPGRISFVDLDQPGVELAAVKPAEHGRGVVVRLASAAGRDLSRLRLRTCLGARRAWLVDLAERELAELPCEQGEVELDLPHGSLRSVLFR